MFDFSFGEVLVVGAVALVVIGPERLPKVARTVGAMVARMQRYVNGVKADLQREMELENLRQIEAEMNEAGRKLAGELTGAGTVLSNSLESAAAEARDALSESPNKTSPATSPHPAPETVAAHEAVAEHEGANEAAAQAEVQYDLFSPPPTTDRPARDRR
ncbi:MAG: twin-arginine translocase subunit TatB [Burkholderiales bacterium]|nr:twin-arginine translocase subunit TatB [Burkholderiales bacterium]